MSIGGKFGEMADNMQRSIKLSTTKILLWMLKFATGLIVGLTLSLIGQTLLDYKVFGFVFGIVVVTAVFLKVSSKWSFAQVFVFDVFCILVALLLRMYVLVAPGA